MVTYIAHTMYHVSWVWVWKNFLPLSYRLVLAYIFTYTL